MTRSFSPSKLFLLALGALFALTLTHAGAIDWVANDGTTYQNVSVVKVEADAVTIIYKNGGALIPLENLPVYLQQKFNYDPVKAKIAATIRAKQEAADAKALQAEIDLAAKKKKQEMISAAAAKDKADAAISR